MTAGQPTSHIVVGWPAIKQGQLRLNTDGSSCDNPGTTGAWGLLRAIELQIFVQNRQVLDSHKRMKLIQNYLRTSFQMVSNHVSKTILDDVIFFLFLSLALG